MVFVVPTAEFSKDFYNDETDKSLFVKFTLYAGSPSYTELFVLPESTSYWNFFETLY